VDTSSEQNVTSSSSHEQPNNRRTWPLFSVIENASNYVTADQDVLGDKREENLSAVTTSSSFQYAQMEVIVSEDSQQNRSEKHSNIVAQILTCFCCRRPTRQRKFDLSWRIFIGTMGDIEEIYACSNFLRDHKWFRFILIFIDSVLRGIGQVMFANSPLSGIIIAIGLFIGNWELACYGLLGACVSTLTAHLFGFDYNSIRAGLYGYNGCLVGMGIAHFSFPQSPHMIGPVVIMSIFSTIFFVAL
jgi:hypothetical protein